ncbi:hypothetical protein D3C87_1363810 [compost metagenome]
MGLVSETLSVLGAVERMPAILPAASRSMSRNSFSAVCFITPSVKPANKVWSRMVKRLLMSRALSVGSVKITDPARTSPFEMVWLSQFLRGSKVTERSAMVMIC